MIDLAKFMNDNLRQLVQTARRSVFSNPREASFAMRFMGSLTKGEKRRRYMKENEGIDVPPFLICSIASTCNLSCAGCYARKTGIAGDEPSRKMMGDKEWLAVFREAVELGFNVALLAGGEPLTRRDVLEAAAMVKDMLFPVFTNGTMIGAVYTEFFRKNPNVVPVVSLEGDAGATDGRRGEGVYRRAVSGMEMLREAGVFYGTSLTVTTENKERVTSAEYIGWLRSLGCNLVFYVEYVPIDEGTEHLAFGDDDVQWMEHRLEELRGQFGDMLFVSFPGDEKLLGGCMAAGRGFFHIGPDGAAEPCPFSPHSDTNVATDGLKAALNSPLFRKLRDASALSWQHTGGCTLYEHRDEVEAMAKQ